MSIARECDVCGKLHAREPGLISVEVNATTEGESDTGWEPLDLCRECGDKVLAIIKPALQEFDEAIKERA